MVRLVESQSNKFDECSEWDKQFGVKLVFNLKNGKVSALTCLIATAESSESSYCEILIENGFLQVLQTSKTTMAKSMLVVCNIKKF